MSPSATNDAAAIRLLEQLVRIPSVSGDEAPAVRWLVHQGRALGFDATVDEVGNATMIIGTGKPEPVLLGHIDTVPGTIPVRIADGKLWGRGAVDAKGPLATFVMAAARLHARGALHGRIVIVGCVEEEAPSSRGAHHAVQYFQPDYCIVGEPSGATRITLGYKGTLRLSCHTETPCGHGAHDRQTATEHMVTWWQHLQHHVNPVNPVYSTRVFDQLQPTLLAINSDSDGLREWAQAEVSIRLPPGVVPQTLIQQIRLLDPQVQIEVLGSVPAFQSPRTTPLVRALASAIRQHDAQPGFVHKTGTADMNIAGPAWGCPIVAYGPGDAALDHTPDEHIVLDEYLCAIRVLETALGTLHGG